MAALSLAVILSLAADPRCGGAAPGSEFAQRLAAIAMKESGGGALVVGVNASAGLPAAVVRSATSQEAAAKARALIAQGRSIDLGLMQLNSSQIARHGLTVEAAFDACRNMRAGAEHYAGDVQAAAIFHLAHQRYNTGSLERGATYAASVEQVLARVRIAAADAVPTNPDDVATPAPRPVPPGLDDALHAAPAPSDDDDGGLSDALHHNTRKDQAE